MSDCTLTKDAYKEVIAEDIKLVEQFIPKEHILRQHILTVLRWSIDQAYPPEYWDKVICDVCDGDGKLYDLDKDDDEIGYSTTCPKCGGKGRYLPEEKNS